jgi:3-methyladenine DNA glycosylase AlkD
MTKNEVLALLEENQNDRGIAHWKKKPRRLKSFGIGLTQLRKLAKKIGRNHELSKELWETDVYDAKVISLLIEVPKEYSREQAEVQVDQLEDGLLRHVFASCDATLAKTPYAFDLACEWMDSDDVNRRRCGYALQYELSKKNPKGMDDEFLLDRIDRIQKTIHEEDMWVRESMAGALLGIGKRTKELNQAAIRAAKAIGPIDVDYGDDNSCEPVNVLKHLESDYVKKKFS